MSESFQKNLVSRKGVSTSFCRPDGKEFLVINSRLRGSELKKLRLVSSVATLTRSAIRFNLYEALNADFEACDEALLIAPGYLTIDYGNSELWNLFRPNLEESCLGVERMLLNFHEAFADQLLLSLTKTDSRARFEKILLTGFPSAPEFRTKYANINWIVSGGRCTPK